MNKSNIPKGFGQLSIKVLGIGVDKADCNLYKDGIKIAEVVIHKCEQGFDLWDLGLGDTYELKFSKGLPNRSRQEETRKELEQD